MEQNEKLERSIGKEIQEQIEEAGKSLREFIVLLARMEKAGVEIADQVNDLRDSIKMLKTVQAAQAKPRLVPVYEEISGESYVLNVSGGNLGGRRSFETAEDLKREILREIGAGKVKVTIEKEPQQGGPGETTF